MSSSLVCVIQCALIAGLIMGKILRCQEIQLNTNHHFRTNSRKLFSKKEIFHLVHITK